MAGLIHFELLTDLFNKIGQKPTFSGPHRTLMYLIDRCVETCYRFEYSSARDPNGGSDGD